jgi:competence protein ComEC
VSAAVPYGALAFVGALVGGIALGQVLGAQSAGFVLATGCVALGVAALVRVPPLRFGIAVLACVLLGSAAMERALHGLEVSPLRGVVERRASGTVRATLLDDPDARRFDADVLVRVDALSGHGAGRRRVLVRATGEVAGRVQLLVAGDGVTLRGWFEPLAGYDARWRWKHAVGVLHATELISATHAAAPLARVANATRALVLSGAEHLAPSDRALLAGFLLGDTRGVPVQLTEEFRAAGLTHLTAVSGENVAFVLALFAPLLRRLALRGRVLGALSVLVVFGTMTRWEPSVLRAITMAAIGLLAGYLGRPTAGLRLLVLTAIVLLVVDPFLLHSVGFLLSCGASVGIAVLARPIAARLPGPPWAREVLGVTAAAQVGVAPVLIPVFGSMPLVALPANLLAVPLAAPLTVWGLTVGVIGGAIRGPVPGATRLLELPTVALLHALIAIADVASSIPLAIDGRAAWGVLALAALTSALHRVGRLRGHARAPVPPR